MKITVRTNRPELRRAVELWCAENDALLPSGSRILSDVDELPALGVPGEITAAHDRDAALELPLSFDALRKALMESGGAGRLFFDGAFYLDGEKLDLTPAEEKILAVLYGAGGVLSAGEIAAAIGEDAPRSNKIAVHVACLRKKTALPAKEPLIFTLHGKGYFIKNE